LLVIHPRTLIDETDYSQLFRHLPALTRGQPAHLTSPHCTVLKDHDEGSDLFMIEACTACPVLRTEDVNDERPASDHS
jgi:hypothetical protein